MKQGLLLLLISGLSFNVFAGTHGMLDENKAIIIVQGEDEDAKRLYESMNVEPVQAKNDFVKAVKIAGSNGEAVLNVSCKWASLVNLTSCTLQIVPFVKAPTNSVVVIDKKHVNMDLADKKLIETAASVFTQNNGIVFVSENELLKVWFEKDQQDQPVSFHLRFDK